MEHAQRVEFWLAQGLDIRAANCLAYKGFGCIEDVTALTPAEMLCTPNFGLKSLASVKGMMLRSGWVYDSGWVRIGTKDGLIITELSALRAKLYEALSKVDSILSNLPRP